MIVLDREEMRRTVMRLSMEIIEKNKGADDLVLVGIRPRGVILAKKMMPRCPLQSRNLS